MAEQFQNLFDSSHVVFHITSRRELPKGGGLQRKQKSNLIKGGGLQREHILISIACFSGAPARAARVQFPKRRENKVRNQNLLFRDGGWEEEGEPGRGSRDNPTQPLNVTRKMQSGFI